MYGIFIYLHWSLECIIHSDIIFAVQFICVRDFIYFLFFPISYDREPRLRFPNRVSGFSIYYNLKFIVYEKRVF